MRAIPLLFSLFVFGTVGCVQYHYSPNTVHTPYITQKGDGMLSAGIGGNPYTLNANFHLSYSPLKHATVMFNYFHTHSSFNNSNFESGNFLGGPVYQQTTKGYLMEGAAGVYTPLGFGTAACYAGWGQGRMLNNYGIDRYADLQLRRFFIQPTFTFKNDWLRLGMAMRVVRLSFPSGDIDYRIDPSDIDILKRIEKDAPIWFPELGGNFGIHFKPVTISANMVLIASRPAADYGFDISNWGIGITFELQEMFKKKGGK